MGCGAFTPFGGDTKADAKHFKPYDIVGLWSALFSGDPAPLETILTGEGSLDLDYPLTFPTYYYSNGVYRWRSSPPSRMTRTGLTPSRSLP